jgi:hypothetical protein
MKNKYDDDDDDDEDDEDDEDEKQKKEKGKKRETPFFYVTFFIFIRSLFFKGYISGISLIDR